MSPKVSGAELDHVTVSPPAGPTVEEQGVSATGVEPGTGLGDGSGLTDYISFCCQVTLCTDSQIRT